MTTNDRYFLEFTEYCEIMVPGRETRRVPKARIDGPEAPQGRRWGDMVALAKEIDRLRELLWQAEQLAVSVVDSHIEELDQAEIDGEMVPTTELQERFKKDMLQPGTHIVPEEPQPVAVEEVPSVPPQPVFVPPILLYTGTGHAHFEDKDVEVLNEYENKAKRRKGK